MKKLSKRQMQIAKLRAGGLTVKEISLHLHISEATVKSTIAIVYNKLGIGNAVQLVMALESMEDEEAS